MRAELIMIGTELLLGEVVDTNASFLAVKLAHCGVDLYYKSTVGDNLSRGKEVLEQALRRSDLVIISGGLGPTEDDLTRDIVSLVTKRELVEDSGVAQDVQNWFYERYGTQTQIPPHNRKQALFPRGSHVLANPVGTAPGFWLDLDGQSIIALPGVPHELKTIFSTSVEPVLLSQTSGQRLVTRNLNFVGIGESRLEEILQDLLAKQSNPTMALYASGGKVRVRLTAKASSQADALSLIEPLTDEIQARTKGYLYGLDGQTLEEVVGHQLMEGGLTVALAESCTGGLVSHLLTNVPGSSSYFQRGYVVYSNQAKQEDLGVPADTLRKFGAVSPETAKAMSEGVRLEAGTDFGLALTGIAGPGGGSPEKPVGLVYISLASSSDTIVQRHLWRGTREQIKNRSALAALQLLWQNSQ